MKGGEANMTGLLSDGREQVYTWLRSCLLGPQDGADSEILTAIKPLDRYQTGILFPVLAHGHGLDAAIDEEEDGEDDNGDGGLHPAAAQGTSQPKRRFVPPSSVGFTFYIEGSEVSEGSEDNEIQLQVIPRALRYEPADEPTKVGRGDQWRPVALGRDDSDALDFGPPPMRRRLQERRAVFDLSPLQYRQQEQPLVSSPASAGRAEVMLLWRPLGAGWLVTVSLSNVQQDPGQGDAPHQAAERNTRALFRVELECLIEAGRVGDYPRVDPSLMDEEERELELQYRAHRIFAIGHGAAVDWEIRGDGVRRLRTAFLPRVEVPQISAEGGPADALVLSIDWQAGIDQDPAPRFEELNRFAERYQDWIERNDEKAADADTPLTAAEQATTSRILARMGEALRRIREGTRLLETDPVARRAFALANRAMARQMRQAARAAGTAPRAPA